MSKDDFADQNMVVDSINNPHKSHNVDIEEPYTLKRAKIMLFEKTFDSFHHFALENLLYDVKYHVT